MGEVLMSQTTLQLTHFHLQVSIHPHLVHKANEKFLCTELLFLLEVFISCGIP